VVIHGHRATLERVAGQVGLTPTSLRWDAVEVVEPDLDVDPAQAPGVCQTAYLESAMDRIMEQPEGCVLVTAPINKLRARRAGFAFPGHTEFLARRSGCGRFAMMMAGPRLKVVLATTHVAIGRLVEALTPRAVSDAIVLAGRSLVEDFGLSRPKLAICGLNPHAGEGGEFGNEEQRIIEPAMETALEELASFQPERRGASGASVDLVGPMPSDTLFWRAIQGDFDGVVAMYHDQGLIPVKLLDFDRTVNVTLGLPFVRTSPDHGTAEDLVGTGRASPDSMMAACDLGLAMGRRRWGAAVDGSDR